MSAMWGVPPSHYGTLPPKPAKPSTIEDLEARVLALLKAAKAPLLSDADGKPAKGCLWRVSRREVQFFNEAGRLMTGWWIKVAGREQIIYEPGLPADPDPDLMPDDAVWADSPAGG